MVLVSNYTEIENNENQLKILKKINTEIDLFINFFSDNKYEQIIKIYKEIQSKIKLYWTTLQNRIKSKDRQDEIFKSNWRSIR